MAKSVAITLVAVLFLGAVLGWSSGRRDVASIAPAQAVMSTASNSNGLVPAHAEGTALRVCPDTEGLRRPIDSENGPGAARLWPGDSGSFGAAPALTLRL